MCSSITLQSNVLASKIEKIRNCSIIVGNLKILNAKFTDLNLTSLYLPNNEALFPNLVEITDYLLIFQAHNIKSLDTLFPRLSIIRGDTLFKNSYSLIIFLTNSLQQINLKNLVELKRGTVLLSRLYNACYTQTIDWSKLIKDKNAAKPTMALSNNDCLNTQICPRECKNKCWSNQNCQLECPPNCESGCYLDHTNKCCSNKLCSYCNMFEKCISCSKFRDLSSGRCVEQCPIGSLVYESHSCVKPSDCSTLNSSLIKNYAQLDDRFCVRECPNGYMSFFNQSIHKILCIECADTVCKKDCSNKTFHIKSKYDLESIKNCYRVKRLLIELADEQHQHILNEHMQYIEEISDYLVVNRNRFLTSLNFLKSLKVIKGESLFEKKYALFVHTNSHLRELWSLWPNKTILINGSVKFFENPNLCFQDIEHLIFNKARVLNAQNSDISFNYNGYNRVVSCSSKFPIKLILEPRATEVIVRWNVTISDLRRLNGFILYYSQLSDNQALSDFKNDNRLDQRNWESLYVEFDENNLKKNRGMIVTFECDPYTKYAVYLKADLAMTNSQIYYLNNRSNLFGQDRLISAINFVQSLPSRKFILKKKFV